MATFELQQIFYGDLWLVTHLEIKVTDCKIVSQINHNSKK